jgi:choline dehydrogenase-like flavoprotein
MLPLTEASAPVVHDDRLPENVFVADASLFPRSLGNPPILTIIALAKRVARICAGNDAAVSSRDSARRRSLLPAP